MSIKWNVKLNHFIFLEKYNLLKKPLKLTFVIRNLWKHAEKPLGSIEHNLGTTGVA
jgi:hypothetical protein